MGIRLPPMNRNIWRLETMLANNILHMQVLMTDIYPEHFAPNGVLAHVHIPTYVYIPNAVFKEYGITIKENTTSYVTFWQRLQEAQWQSTELIEPEHLRSTYKTSYRKLLRNQAPNEANLKIDDLNQADSDLDDIEDFVEADPNQDGYTLEEPEPGRCQRNISEG